MRYFLVFLDLESKNDRWNEEDVHKNEKNLSNTSKLLLKIKNPWLMVKKWILGFIKMKMWKKEKIEKMDRKWS